MSEDEREKVVKQSDENSEPEVEAHKRLAPVQDDGADESDEPDVEAHRRLAP